MGFRKVRIAVRSNEIDETRQKALGLIHGAGEMTPGESTKRTPLPVIFFRTKDSLAVVGGISCC